MCVPPSRFETDGVFLAAVWALAARRTRSAAVRQLRYLSDWEQLALLLAARQSGSCVWLGLGRLWAGSVGNCAPRHSRWGCADSVQGLHQPEGRVVTLERDDPGHLTWQVDVPGVAPEHACSVGERTRFNRARAGRVVTHRSLEKEDPQGHHVRWAEELQEWPGLGSLCLGGRHNAYGSASREGGPKADLSEQAVPNVHRLRGRPSEPLGPYVACRNAA
jgi:hypothetical protein